MRCLVAVLAIATAFASVGIAQEKSTLLCESPTWARVVSLASQGRHGNRTMIEEIARSDDEEVAALAQAVLKLWAPGSPRPTIKAPYLVRPRSIHITPDEVKRFGEIETTAVLATVTVTTKGCVGKIEVLRGPDGKLRDLILDRLKSAVFFPARRGNQFIESTTTVSINVDVR